MVGADPVLGLVGHFRRSVAARAQRPMALAQLPAVPVSEFPPADLFTVADPAVGEVVFVVPVRSDSRDWGMLAAVGRIQDRTPPGRELMNQAGALLAVALDQDAMLRSLRDQEERLRRAALYDHLTGLANRELFLDRLGQAVRRARRQPEHRFGVLFCDLDGFKSINDTFGHAAGDQLLVGVARRIRAGLRDSDTAARFGGDEFLVLLDSIGDPQLPEVVVGRLHAALARPFLLEGRPVTIAASIGLACSGAGDDTAEGLLREADLAMYRAKSAKKVTRLDRGQGAGAA